MGAPPREGGVAGAAEMAVLGGETASLLDAPGELADRNPHSRAFETGGGAGRGYTVIEDRNGGGPEGPPDLSLSNFQSYHAQPPASIPDRHASLPTEQHQGTSSNNNSSSSTKNKKRTRTRFPSLTPALAPAPGTFSANGGTRAAEAVAQARKTWAPPVLRTKAIASYGAVPDLEIIPENIEVSRFQKRQRAGRHSDLGCPSCVIS
ncbi:unnamed protein product [Ectocarpus sp. 4 AP-2014]